MRSGTLAIQQKLRLERIKIAKVRVMLMDMAVLAKEPHIKKHAEDALALLNEPVDKYVGTK
jgi:hypothetical protein